jgi:hypothetical protein
VLPYEVKVPVHLTTIDLVEVDVLAEFHVTTPVDVSRDAAVLLVTILNDFENDVPLDGEVAVFPDVVEPDAPDWYL